jgi:hypothetical protein
VWAQPPPPSLASVSAAAMAASASFCTLQQQVYNLLSGAASADPTSPGPSEFCCFGPLTRIAPGLEVPGLGKVGLPLDAQQAEALKAGPARLAPFGRGEETITDTDVRHTWQLEPEQLSLTNPRASQDCRHAPGAASCRSHQCLLPRSLPICCPV